MTTKPKKGNTKAYAGWSTLNKKDALVSVSAGLRRYNLDNPLLSINSRRFNLEDGDTQWRIRSNGKPLCNIVIRANRKGGVKLSYELPEQVTNEIRHSIEQISKQLHDHLKLCIDADNNIGTHWEIPGVPNKVKKRIEWSKAWDEIKEYRRSSKQAGYNVKLADIVDFFLYADKDTPLFGENTIQKLIEAGEEGKLDNVKSYRTYT